MILLYNPWSTPSHKKPLPMSLLAVASMLEGVYEYEIVDGNLLDDPVRYMIDLGRSKKLTAIGITVMPGPQLNMAVPHSRRLKATFPGVPIIWGGYFPSHHTATVLQNDAVDFCVHSQGEHTFFDLIGLLRNGGDPAAIPGLIYKDRGHIRRNPHRPLIPLDDLPDWPYHRLPMARYFHTHYLGRRVGSHHSSYGCPFGCNFCAVVEMSNRRWVAQSPERVARTLASLQKDYGMDAVQFHDMDFFIHEQRTAETAERIAPLGLTWWGLGRIDELMRYSDTTWQTLKRSGLNMVFCGAESGSADVLQRMNKGGKVSPRLTLELARRMKSYGIVPEFSFVVGNPPDPAHDLDTTFQFIRRLKAVNPATEIILYVYTPVAMDGTLYADAREAGFTFPDTLDAWTTGVWRDFALRRDPKTPWLDMDIKRKMRNFERVLNAYYPTTTDRTLTGLKRAMLRSLGAWRYKTEFYAFPIELRAFHRLFHYQRPETTGF
ncbi:MAG: B12-binding domain-containing radical SAM protein [Rhodothermales bacterium]